MDGLIVAEAARYGPGAPFLFLLGEIPLEAEADRVVVGSGEHRELEFDWRSTHACELAKSGGDQVVQLYGMRHFKFSDRQFYAPWPSSDRGLAAQFLNRVRFRPNSEGCGKGCPHDQSTPSCFFEAHVRRLK